MKKTLKELLWFVIPTVLIIAVYVATYILADSQINMPKWFGTKYYLSLFIKSPDFAEVVFNTVLFCVVPALSMAVAVFVVQLFAKMKRPLYYGVMATTATLANLCFKAFYLNPKFLGSPYTSYPADTIIIKPEEYTPSILDMLKSITAMDVLQSLLIATITCFVFWVIELIVATIKKKEKIKNKLRR